MTGRARPRRSPAAKLALADLRRIRRAARTCRPPLPNTAVAVIDQLAAHAMAAIDTGGQFAIELDRIVTDTGRTHVAVAHAITDLIAAGWIARDAAGRWYPAIPVPTPAAPAPTPEQP